MKNKIRLNVGANCVRPKTDKGITIIALVITIIIMLILVAVTITYMIRSGLITKAKNSKNDYKIAEEKDILSAVLNNWQVEKNTKNEKTFVEFITEELQNQANVIDSAEYILVEFKESKNCYKVTENEKIEILLSQEVEKQKKYAKFLEGYQQVEYLQNTGKQWIDTGIAINTLVNPIIEAEFKFTSGDTDKFGTSTVGSNTILWNMSGSTTYLRYGTTTSRTITYESGFSSNDLNFTDFHKLRVGDGITPITGQVPIYVDDILIGRFNANDKAKLSSSENLLLYKGRNNSPCTFKSFKITDNDVVIIDLIPCIEKVDGETKEIKITLEGDIQNCKQAKAFLDEKLSEINEIQRYSGKLTNQNQVLEKYNLIDVNVEYGISTGATRYNSIKPTWGNEKFDLKVYPGDVISGNLLKNPLRGMYDLVKEEFYANQGTADFSAGEVIN